MSDDVQVPEDPLPSIGDGAPADQPPAEKTTATKNSSSSVITRKSTSTKSAAVKKAAPRKAVSKKAASKKAASKKAASKKTPARRAPSTKNPVAEKAAPKKTLAEKAPAKRSSAKKAAKKVPAPKRVAKKPAAKKPAASTSSAETVAAASSAWSQPPASGAADDDWHQGSTLVDTRPSRLAPPLPPLSSTTAWGPSRASAPAPVTRPTPPARWLDQDGAKADDKRPRRTKLILALVVIGAAAVAVALLLVANRDAGGIDYSKLKVGDCLETPDGGEVRAVTVKPCSEPHDAEVYSTVDHPAPRGARYPGVDALVDFAGDTCLGDAFTQYVGMARTQSTLKNLEIVPKKSAWDDGRRRMVCAVDNGGERLVGSVKGSGR